MRSSVGSTLPPTRLNAATEQVRGLCVWTPASSSPEEWENWEVARALVALWVEVGGFRFAVDVLRAEPTLEAVISKVDRTIMEVVLSKATTPVHAIGFHSDMKWLWWALRLRVSAMSVEALARARSDCADLLKGVPSGDPSTVNRGGAAWYKRQALVFALSRDRELAGQQIDLLLAAIGRREWMAAELLVAAAPDLARAKAVAKRATTNGPFKLGAYSFDVVEALGTDAAPFLAELYEAKRKNTSAQYLTAEKAAVDFVARAASGRPQPGALKVKLAPKKQPVAKKLPAGKKVPVGKKLPVKSTASARK